MSMSMARPNSTNIHYAYVDTRRYYTGIVANIAAAAAAAVVEWVGIKDKPTSLSF